MSLNAITGGLDVPPGDNSVVAPLSLFFSCCLQGARILRARERENA
jgi:hypothetical protein